MAAVEAPAVLLRAVGRRARALRVQRQLTLDELSALSGVSRRTITLLEAGEANASLATLDKLARALGTDFGSLVTDRPVAPLVPEASGEVAPVWQDGLGSSARLLVAYPARTTTELWQWELAGGARYQAEPDPPGSEELIWVSAGGLVIDVEGEELALGAGGYLRLPSDRQYAYVNPGPGKTTFVRVVTT
jgi:transcriptional regulator with XRE-family HTH domain